MHEKAFVKKALSIFLLSLNLLYAAENPVPPKKDQVTNAITVQPLSMILNSYFINFEHLFANRHGVVLEAGYIGYYKFSWGSGSKNAAWNIEQGYSLALHYRFHFSKEMDSAFAGVFVKYGSVGGTILSTEDETKMLPSDPTQPRIGFVSTYTILGLNGGYRWVFYGGLTVVLRLGAGIDSTKYTYSRNDYEQERNIFKDIFGGFLNVDAEISAGYAF